MRTTHQASCEECPAGHACKAGASEPIECLAGSKVSSDTSVCEPCAAGQFQDQAGQTSCKPCDAGSFCAQGADMPTACPKGSFTNASMLKDTCEACEAGKYQNEEGKQACTACPLGSYCPEGASAALKCEAGSFQDRNAQVS